MTDGTQKLYHNYSFVDTQRRLIVNGMRMLSEYWLAYTSSFGRASLFPLLLSNEQNYYFSPKNIENDTYYNQLIYHYAGWLKYTDAQFTKHLRSNIFLESFQRYVDELIDANRYVKKIGYLSPLSLLDDCIDNLLKTLSSIESAIFFSTPHEIVHRKDDTRLLRYYYYHKAHKDKEKDGKQEQELQPEEDLDSDGKLEYKTPLLMVYAPINRYHILDLTPDRSIVNQFVSRGFDVFLLDWGEQKNNKSTVTDYINYIDDCVEDIKKITNSDKINLFGYSWGGVLSMIYTSLYNDKKNIRNLIIQSSQADFDKDKTTIAEWMRSFPANKYIEEFGEMHGHIMDLAFLMRNPLIHRFDNIKFALDMQIKKYNNDRDAVDDNVKNNHCNISFMRFLRDLFRVNVWLNNTPDIQGEFFREFAKKMYQQNLLIKGEMMLDRNDGNKNITQTSKTVNLKDIAVPLLNIVGTEDDLVEPTSSIPLNDVVSSTDKKLIQFPLGHVELCISSHAHNNLWPEVVQWLQERSS